MNLPLLTTLVLVPLVGALVTAFIPAHRGPGGSTLAKQVGLGFSLLTLAAAVVVAVRYELDGGMQLEEVHEWVSALGVHYALGVDGLGLGGKSYGKFSGFCTEDQAFPVTVTGDNGELTLDEQPEAIVSMSASATEMLFAMGAGTQVEAVDSTSNYPEDAPITDDAAPALAREEAATVIRAFLGLTLSPAC